MIQNKFRPSEVISFLEEKIAYGEETIKELEFYQNLKWNGTAVKDNTYKNLVKQMKCEYNGF